MIAPLYLILLYLTPTLSMPPNMDEQPQQPAITSSNATLFYHPACAADIEAALASRRCQPVEAFRKSDFALIACLSNLAPDNSVTGEKDDAVGSGLSAQCENVLWDFKVNLTNDDALLEDVKQACPEDFDKFHECQLNPRKNQPQNSRVKNGRILSCAIELKNDPEKHFVDACATRLTEIESVVFSDYRLVGNFVEKCLEDVGKLECGRLEGRTSHHSQGKVIECLTDHMASLSQPCRNQIFVVAEYQGDDYHLDRSLFLACKRDRHNLCADEKAGEGRVFDCLMRNKMAPEMSKRCRLQLLRRQKLISEDYKVSRGLVVGCRHEIEKNKCIDNLSKGDHMTIKLAQVLLCLEDVLRNEENEISGSCRLEMKEHRRMLMEDYRVSPEVVDACRSDIKEHCGTVGAEGEMLHCLMRVASEHHLEEKCEAILKDILRQVDVASDWKMDPILQKNCQEVVTSSCDMKSGNEAVLSCLMTLAAKGARQMSHACKSTVMEIQYFLARDFTLNPQLYRKCHKDATRLCKADTDWHKRKENAEHKLIFPCLVRYLYVNEEEDPNGEIGELSEDCADEVELVLEQRAISVNLHPDIEEVCRANLVQYCGERVNIGEEMVCLQDNLENLSEECKKAVEEFAKIESRNTHLNQAIATNCMDIIAKECRAGMGQRDEGKVMRCLIDYRSQNMETMDKKCSLAVEHWQIFTLNDWKFSPSFKKSCQKDIKNLCEPLPRTKIDVLSCLSEAVQKDLLNDEKPKVSEKCQAELKFELLQKHSDVKLNPKLERYCNQELETLCANDRTLECLKQQDHSALGDKCRMLVFEQEREEVVMNEVDPVLMKKCGDEIQRHCKAQGSPNSILECLEENKDDVNFDPKCRQVVIRRIVQEMKDYRLNPRLQKACAQDLIKFCSSIIYNNRDKQTEKDFLEGLVIQCLKDKFIDDDKLTRPCKHEVENLLRNAAVDIRANPRLIKTCPKSIDYCRTLTHTDASKMGDGGQVEECLKGLYVNHTLNLDSPDCIQEVAKVIEADAMDIKIDHVLFEACSLDLSKFCREVVPGSGQQVACLRNVAEDKGLKLEPKCEGVLHKRMDMYAMALRAFPVRGVNDVLQHVAASPHRNYFLMVGLTFLGVIFVVGLLCGRVTKRVRRELKIK